MFKTLIKFIFEIARKKGLPFIKNDVVFWVFFLILSLCMVTFVLKKEDIKIAIILSEPYDNKVITLFGR